MRLPDVSMLVAGATGCRRVPREGKRARNTSLVSVARQSTIVSGCVARTSWMLRSSSLLSSEASAWKP